MAISRKRRDNDENIFSAPTAEIFEDVDHEDSPAESKNDRYDDLAQQMADMQKRLNEAEAERMVLLQSPNRWQSQVSEVTEIKPESIQLPDPALDPTGFEAAIVKRNEIRNANEKRRSDHAASQQRELSSKVEDLWNDFGDAYPDISDDKERIDFVATQVVKDAQKKGLDVERYMFTTRDRFMADVAKKYEKVFGSADDDNNDDDDFEDVPTRRNLASRDGTRGRSNRRNREEADDNRTGGIFGGNESRRPSASRRDRDDETGPSMIDDIYAIQKKTGFF